MARQNAAATPFSAAPLLLLIAANLLIPLAILIFAKGFFPYKPLFPGLAQYDDDPDYGTPPPAPFDRVVFMVVDALRSDFVYVANTGFEYTQSLIRDGAALPFTAHATSPTVTMPRIKAITTGSIPSFLDVVLNIDEGDKSSSLASQDTWLAQMKAKATGKLVLYGDDTWLKLFPDTFDKADGTSSFFVADFTEVDNNVTRHITDELRNDDWSTMVLHYLGLDHIGHKGGPRSPNMLPKQREMDAVVKEIYEAIDSQPHLSSTLLVLCGDHGMNDAGNHGASSAGETSPALVFISPKMRALPTRFDSPVREREDFQYYGTVEQSDLAPTLGGLLGFPVPKNNLGAFIPDFLPFWPEKKDKTQILMRNAHQILEILTASFGADTFEAGSESAARCADPQSDVEELGCEWQSIVLSTGRQQDYEELDAQWIERTAKWLRSAQRIMSGMASNYDMPKLAVGQGLAIGAVVLAVASCYLSAANPLWSFSFFIFVCAAYGIMMFASSYVEEEHHFWYWASSAWLALLGMQRLNGTATKATRPVLAMIAAFAALRLIRGWNQTGQKFAGEPDLVKTFLAPNPTLLWALVSLAYLRVHRGLVRGLEGLLPLPAAVAGATGLVLAAFSFKLAFTGEDSPELVGGGFARALGDLLVSASAGVGLVARARAVFIGLAMCAACVVYFVFTKRAFEFRVSPMETLLNLYTLLAMTQSRATNIPLFLLFNILYTYLSSSAASSSSSALTLPGLTTATLLLQYASFFACGGTNAISSVDLSSAYNGVAGFDVVAVGVLTFVSNWAAPLWWTFAANVLLVRLQDVEDVESMEREKEEEENSGKVDGRGRGRGDIFLRHACQLTVFAAVAAAAVMAACTALRTHLFVWTVFSPKYLYCVAWSLGMHLLANLGLGGALYWLGRRWRR